MSLKKTVQLKSEELNEFMLPAAVQIVGGRVEAFKSLEHTREMALKQK